MTEAVFWSGTVRPKLGQFGTLRRIENRIGEGTPDVLFCLRRYAKGNFPAVSGLLELKHLYAWCARDTTPTKFNHFTLGQISWLESWDDCGGRCAILAQIDKDYMLIPAQHARRIYNGVGRPEFLGLAAVHAHGTFPTADIIRWLTR